MPKRVKKTREMDVNELAYEMVRRLSGGPPQDAPTATKDEVSRVMSVLGRKGGRVGGKRRMETMTPEQRSAIALKAARARWAKVARKKR
jgi:hypothetical protein